MGATVPAHMEFPGVWGTSMKRNLLECSVGRHGGRTCPMSYGNKGKPLPQLVAWVWIRRASQSPFDSSKMSPAGCGQEWGVREAFHQGWE